MHPRRRKVANAGRGMILLTTGCTAPVELPAPTGGGAIGETTIHLVEDALERFADDGTYREITVHLWYPAAPDADPTPAAYVPELDALKPALDHRTRRLWKHITTHANLDAPRADGSAFPVVVLSHGNDMNGAQYSFLIEDLVSHGYAVVAIDHAYDARAVLLADGTAVPFDEDAWPALPPPAADGAPDPNSDYALFYQERVEVRSQDATFALDALASDDRLGLERVVFVGHSVGGVTAGQFCQDDPRAGGCINLDGDSGTGPFYLQDDGSAFAPPYLMLTKPFAPTDDELAGWGLTRDEWTARIQAQRDAYFGAVGGGAWRIELDGAAHDSFTDEPYAVAALTGGDPAADLERLRIVRLYTLAFVAMALGDGAAAALDDGEPGVAIERWPLTE